ncbi:class I SAM-dependent methyltransferase [Halomonas heilongjiangensis]|uniref:SAM-dependent methyltransferase n=1 Tax=Halomonas heilongjiangensis TaxID=1387883 RepID=A0A2N7TJV6_9GAMM|nr:class I SAM-dependent methyltransferase [Halomonas heilongjiangensis]PMR68464.1 SAM-dependent methyltransferase [Halomonas heilongjiangensis]PXX86623.1 SAM-dependent methyltransferase [Halomonas heilongjiangensis]
MTTKPHWERLYATKPSHRLGWYEPSLQTSLALIRRTGVTRAAPIIDVGGGASTLVDDLLEAGFEDLTVLDIAAAALAQARARLGERAGRVRWIEGDVTDVILPDDHYAIWHDRAVFHFLTDAEDRTRYVDRLWRALTAGGHIVIATFAPEAPPTCSGLAVVRYTPEGLHRELGASLTLREHHQALHVTPGGVEQRYLYCRFQKPD